MSVSYRLFDHTSDLGVEVRGNSLKSLFHNAAMAVLDLAIDAGSTKPKIVKKIEITESNHELLLKEWLSEIVYQTMTLEFMISEIRITQLTSQKIDAEIGGEKHNSHRHPIRRELKGITYHQLSIREQEKSWKARFVIDV